MGANDFCSILYDEPIKEEFYDEAYNEALGCNQGITVIK